MLTIRRDSRTRNISIPKNGKRTIRKESDRLLTLLNFDLCKERQWTMV
jgi:hypothetical protein